MKPGFLSHFFFSNPASQQYLFIIHQPRRERRHYQGPTCAIRIAYAIGTDVSFIACELIFGLTKCVERD
jgi:hypothetical protein